MPNIYAKHHDKFVENFVNNLDSKSNISERLLMAKNKMNYLFPIFLTVKVEIIIFPTILILKLKAFTIYFQ